MDQYTFFFAFFVLWAILPALNQKAEIDPVKKEVRFYGKLFIYRFQSIYNIKEVEMKLHKAWD